MMEPIRIGILGYENVAALDLIGPLEAFAAASLDGNQSQRYETSIIGITPRPFVSESGVVLKPHRTLSSSYEVDTLIIPGGKGLREASINRRVANWVARRAPTLRRIASVCTGIYGLAPTGLLNRRHVATHWRFTQDLARRFPALRVDSDALFRKDGKFYTSAGVTAGIDLALALIEEDYGPRVALAAARELVVYLKRAGGQAQYSEPLQFQLESADSFSDLAAWILGHLDCDLSVAVLARRVCLCERHFNRRFKSAFDRTPAAFVEDLRLSEARRRLSAPLASVDRIATSVGFRSADVFRRAFARRFGIAPSDYRRRFELRTRREGRR